MRFPVMPRASSEEVRASSSSRALAEAASEEEGTAPSSPEAAAAAEAALAAAPPLAKTGDPASRSLATSSLGLPRSDTSSPILSATSSAIPFWSTSSLRTASHGSLSSLSIAEHAALNLAAGTPAAASPPSRRPRWLSLISWLSSPRASRTSVFFFFFFFFLRGKESEFLSFFFLRKSFPSPQKEKTKKHNLSPHLSHSISPLFFSPVRTLSTSASGAIAAAAPAPYDPATSKSHWKNSRKRPRAIAGWSLR